MVQQFLLHLLTRPGALVVNVSSGVAFVPLPRALVYCATKAAMHSYTQLLRAQLQATGVAAVELAPPAVEMPLFRGQFTKQTREQKGINPKKLVQRAIADIEAGKLEIRPGLANVLSVMSRIALRFMLGQLVKMSRTKK